MNDLDQEFHPPSKATGGRPSPAPHRRRALAGPPTTHPEEAASANRPPARARAEETARRATPNAGPDVRAEQARVEFAAIARAEADEIEVDKGAVGVVARANAVSIRMGSLGVAFARSVRLRQGFARTVVAGEATIEQGAARTIVANRVSLGPQSLTGLVVARRVDGPGRAILDWRGALLLGGALVLFRLLGRRPRSA